MLFSSFLCLPKETKHPFSRLASFFFLNEKETKSQEKTIASAHGQSTWRFFAPALPLRWEINCISLTWTPAPEESERVCLFYLLVITPTRAKWIKVHQEAKTGQD
jgi:hypothetical protein